jgi:hypothetical protein
MKKYILICFVFILLFSVKLQSQEQTEGEFFFYQLDEEEIKDYFDKFQFLIALDKNKVEFTDDKLETFFTKYIGKDSIECLLLESFFRQTKNKKIQTKVLKYIEKNNLNDEYSQSLFRLYNSKVKKYKQDKTEQIQYNYKDQYYDENINLFYQSETLVFNKELGLMLFENPWTNINYKKDDEKNENSGSFFLIYGGGTNSMTINFFKYSDVSFDQFKTQEIDKKYFSDKYKKWKIVELEKKGILEKSGSDKIFIGYGVGPDIVPDIDTATFNIYLYNEKLQKGYSISYFMNFSKINNNYKLRQRIWNQLLLQLCFSFINIS